MKLMAAAHQGQGRKKTDQVTAYLKGLTSKEVTRPTMILVALFFFQNCTGFIATIFYSVDIFKVSDFERLSRIRIDESSLGKSQSVIKEEWMKMNVVLLC